MEALGGLMTMKTTSRANDHNVSSNKTTIDLTRLRIDDLEDKVCFING